MPKKVIKRDLLLPIGLGISLCLLLVIAFPYVEHYLVVKKSTQMEVLSPNIFSLFNKESLVEVSILGLSDSFVVKKKDGHWFVEDTPVDMTPFFTSLSNFKQTDLLSRNPKNHMELGVSKSIGTLVTLRTDSNSISFIIGNPSAVDDSFYFRLENSNDVYIAKGDLRSVIATLKK
jgi:hypothetical protein